ncbi:exodeoxyribonuclease III [Agathobaculum sp.]|uniref:exodeoxyribonuclease III n=1 Tax=Agathobaculum sp. TaxID=2048138 RepID=UPI002A829534|nr:exodeoxyribonuclease III [Agathobaculum sp.]MDY3618800.1 exodeoxyribonuclease III [Agathobaculum sp.]
MKLISWNVNGLRACVGKGFFEFIEAQQPDVLCLQETKLQPEQAPQIVGYHTYWNSADKKGYSGVALLSKQQPLRVSNGLGIDEHDHEGRVITAEYPGFYLVTVYTPNSQDELKRLDYRMQWEDAFRAYVCRLDESKPVVICGDMNVAHEEIDLKNPKANRRNAGFSDDERQKMTELLAAGFTDTFRAFYPDLTGAYSWWSYRFKAREKNAGWRIDYFLVSNRFADRVRQAGILSDVFGSDHCPVLIEIED